MVISATVTLESLHCILESDLGKTGNSEPYIWAALVSISNEEAPVKISITPESAALWQSRTIIKHGMQAGQTAIIPYPVNTLKAYFDEGLTIHQLILVVVLLEKDDTPDQVVQAGYQAFLDELHSQISNNILFLNQANDEEQKAIVDRIKKSIYDKVQSAESDKFSSWEKTKIALGWLNVDDVQGTDFKRFPDLVSSSFTLTFNGNAGDLIVIDSTHDHTGGGRTWNPSVQYQIQGNLEVQTVTVDSCQAQIDAVNKAQAALKGLEDMVMSLQNQLQHDTPQQKPGIIATIKDINESKIPAVEKAIQDAQQTLERCRRLPPRPSIGPAITR